MAKHRSKPVLFLAVVLAAAGVLMFRRQSPQPTPIDVIAESSPEVTLSGMSADGKIILTLKQKKGADTTGWTLTAKQGEEAAKTIWSAALPVDTTMSIPLNAVSPDNKYMFLKQIGPDKTRYVVLTTSGAPLPKGVQTVEFVDKFESKYPEYKISEATGWGGLNLIVFNTDQVKGGVGPSFWFDLSGQSFIRLSNRFN